MRAAVYVRVSTEEQAERGFSIQDQIERCTEKARELGAEEVEVFADEGYSGADPLRPALQRLLQGVKEGEFGLVICLDVDRLARDLADQLAFASEIEKHARLEFVTHSRGDPNSPEDTLFFQMKGAFAQYERAKIRQRTISGRLKKAKSGKIVIPGAGHRRSGPYGYAYNANPADPQLIVIEDEAKVVRQMFEWVAVEGLGISAVTVRLNEMGVPSPRGGRWHTSTVSRILHSELYAGVFYNFKWRTEAKAPGEKKRVYRKRPPEEWIPVRVPALVSRELWNRVQEVIREHGRALLRGRRYESLLAGRIRCGLCGRKFYACPQRGRLYYRCSGKKRVVTFEKCASPQVPAQSCPTRRGLDEVVWEAVAQRLKNPQLLKEELERQVSSGKLAEIIASLRLELEKTERKAADLERQKDELMDLRMEGLLTPEDLKTRLKKIKDLQLRLAETARTLRTRLEGLEKRAQAPLSVEEFCARFAEYLDGLDGRKKREIIRALNIWVTVYPDGRVVVEWPFGDDAAVPVEVRLTKKAGPGYRFQVHLGLTAGDRERFLEAARRRGVSGAELAREALCRCVFDASWAESLSVPRKASGRVAYETGVSVPDDVWTELNRLSALTGRSRREIVRRAVEDYLELVERKLPE